MIETTALGAAGLAGIGGGVWRDAAEFIGTRQFTRFTPAMDKEAADALVTGWQRTVRAALTWARDKGQDERPVRKKKRPAAKSAAPSSTKSKSKSARGRSR
jgi:hypothetical protein